MLKKSFGKYLSLFLMLALAFSQWPVNTTAMISDDMHCMTQSEMSPAAETGKDCCSGCHKDQSGKNAFCKIHCAAAAQTAMLPSMSFLPIRHTAYTSYGMVNNAVTGNTPSFVLPPPKA